MSLVRRLSSITWSLTAIALALGLAPAPACSAAPAEIPELEVGSFVLVLTTDGRTRRGFVDPLTGPAALWLRNESPGILLRSTLAWERVLRVRSADAADEFRLPPFVSLAAPPVGVQPLLPQGVGLPVAPQEVVPVQPSGPLPALPGPGGLFNPIGPQLPPAPFRPSTWMLPGAILPYPSVGVPPSPPVPPRLSPEIAPGVPTSCATRGRVRTLQVQAQAINWDADAAADGLRLLVQPIARDGRLTETQGSLSVELLARRFSRVRNDDEVRVIERWTRELRPMDFGPDGAVVDLPYRSDRPLRDPDLIPVGFVNARLRVPSQGAFDARQDAVILRGGSPL